MADNDGEIGSDEVGDPRTNGYVYLGDLRGRLAGTAILSTALIVSNTATDEAGEAIEPDGDEGALIQVLADGNFSDEMPDERDSETRLVIPIVVKG